MAETLETIKKYIGPFSGAQMDQIFYEILNYTSERYAKGTANGQAVAAGTIGYNDNSYYYSRQALQSAQAAANAADRAEAAVPAGIDSAVLFTRAQTLTAAQQAQARANIKAGGSNPNLLLNAWFLIDQYPNKSGSVFNANTYILDGWMTSYGTATGDSTWSWDSNSGVTFNIGTGKYLFQRIPKYINLNGEQITGSILDSNGNIFSGTITRNTSITYQNMFTGQASSGRPGLQIRTLGGYEVFYISLPAGLQTTIRAVKLEKGTVSTLANDAPPDDRLELLKCKEYYRKVELGSGTLTLALCMAYSAQAALMPNIFGIGNGMRKADEITLTRSGEWYLVAPDGTEIAITNMNVGTSGSDTATLQVFTAANALTKGTIYRLIGRSGAKLVLSNNL